MENTKEKDNEKINENNVKIYPKKEIYENNSNTLRKISNQTDQSNQSNQSNQPNSNEAKKIPFCSRKKILIAIIISAIALIVVLGISLGVIIPKGKKKIIDGENNEEIQEGNPIEKTEDIKIEDLENNKNDNKEKEKPLIISKEIAMEAFEPSFKVNSKKDILTQLSLKSIQQYNTVSNGEKSSYSIFTKAKYDIYTLNETSPGEEDKDFYSTKYSTVITLNSFCTELTFDSLENDCEYEEYLNLNNRNNNNLRRNDEEDIFEIFKQAILPICLIEHTDTNLIISVTCPETLSNNLKNDIILAFKSIKPNSVKGIKDNKTLDETKIEEKDNKIYIESFDRNCIEYDGDPNKNMTCELIRNIITDKEGNLIFSKKISNSETVLNEKNKYSKNLTYLFEDITKQNSNNLNHKNFKSNAESIFDIIKSFMKKEDYILEGDLKELYKELLNDEDENKNQTQNLMRNLDDPTTTEERGVQEEEAFSKTVYDITMNLNIKNDIGLGVDRSAKAISQYNKGSISKNLSYNYIITNLNNTLNEFIILSKSGNKLARDLYDEINGRILNLENFIDSNINDLNNILAFKDLSSIFDSTLAIDDLQNLPYKFIASAENLYNDLDELNMYVPYKIDDMRNLFKNTILSFLTTSHNLLSKIYSNLNEVNNILSSKKSKIVEISTYYLNHTDTSYANKTLKAKEIFDNYYKKEKEHIESKVNILFDEFKNISNDFLKDHQYKINKIVNRIDNGDTRINLASVEDHKNIIKNLYNSNILVKDIISQVEKKFKEAMNIKSNGFFETQQEIDNNKNIYDKISEEAINISYTLDKNELIDKTFDNIMTKFRDQYIVILYYMDTLKLERFPLRENVLINSLFNEEYMNQTDDFFKNEMKKIKNFIETENNKYYSSINNLLKPFKSDNNKDLEDILEDLKRELSDTPLYNLNNTFDEVISITKDSIDKLIDDHYINAIQYLQNVKNSDSTHCTQSFINKYNTFMNYLNEIKNFINYNLKNNLACIYKNVINQIKILLYSIKTNKVLKKYYNQFPFAETHLKEIDHLLKIFEKYISDKNFNKIYLPIISNYIKLTNDKLNQNENKILNLYNSVASLSYSSSTSFDYYHYISNCHTECKFRFGFCWKHYTVCHPYYQGYNVEGTNNYMNLKSINFTQYISKFDKKYNELYNPFSYNINLYNNHLEELYNKTESTKNEILNEDTNTIYLNSLSEKINSIINNKLGNNLLLSSYNYYKYQINTNLPQLLNDILEKIKNIYDEIYEDINLNKNNFKSSIYEFYYASSFYSQMFVENILYEYGDSIFDKCKNELNYTIKYYYNMILSKVNKTYSYILHNIPINEKPFDEILNRRKNEINQFFKDFINKINLSKNEILIKENQEQILKINEKNFFNAYNYIINNINDLENQLQEKIDNFEILADELYTGETHEELIVAKYYLENSMNGKQINEIFSNYYKETFIDFQYNVYEKLFKDIMKIDIDELKNNINQAIINSKEMIENNFKFEKKQYIDILKNKIYKELYKPEELELLIKDMFSKGLKSINQNHKNIIYGYIDEVLNKIKSHISSEASRISYEMTLYSKNFTNITNTLDNYKKIISEKFNSTILSAINNFYSSIINEFYSNYIVFHLNKYQEFVINEKYGEAHFLNISINFTNIIYEIINNVNSEYENLSKKQIDFLYEINFQKLDNIISFSNIEKTIYDEIDQVYITKLLPVLNKTEDFISNYEIYENYNLNTTSFEEIEQILEVKINQTKKIIIENMKGNDIDIIKKNWTNPNFVDFKQYEFSDIKTYILLFNETNHNNENSQFEEILYQNNW